MSPVTNLRPLTIAVAPGLQAPVVASVAPFTTESITGTSGSPSLETSLAFLEDWLIELVLAPAIAISLVKVTPPYVEEMRTVCAGAPA